MSSNWGSHKDTILDMEVRVPSFEFMIIWDYKVY